MVSCLKKYPIKIILFLSIFICFAALIITVSVHVFLAVSKNKIIHAVDTYFGKKISIEDIVFLPPNTIVLKNLRLPGILSPEEERVLAIQDIKIKFSLWRFFLGQQIYVCEARINGLEVDYSRFFSYIRNNFSEIWEFIKSLPNQDVVLGINSARFNLARKGNSREYFLTEFNLAVKKDVISGAGSIRKDIETGVSDSGAETTVLVKGKPLEYNFKTVLTKEGLSIENLELTLVDYYLKLWGETAGTKLQLSGFAYKDILHQGRGSQEPGVTIYERIRKLIFWPKASPIIIGFSRKNLDVLDIRCLANLSFPLIQIERLNLFFNNLYCGVKGDVEFLEDILLNLKISLSSVEPHSVKDSDLKKINFDLAGALRNGAFKGGVDFELFKESKNSSPLEKLEADLRGVVFYYYKYPQLKLIFKEAGVFCQTGSNTYKADITGAGAFIEHQGNTLKLTRIHSLFYDGILDGNGEIIIYPLPAKSSFSLRIKDASANKLDGLLVHFSKVHGILSSRLGFKSYPVMELSGKMFMNKGYLEDFEFLKWLAGFFDLPSLKRIDFENLESGFLVNESGAGLNGIDLRSKNVNVSGDFSLHTDNLVSSKLSLALSKEILQESVKLAPLLRLLGNEFESLIFNFQLSGILESMNFQWLESDFKKKLRESVPGFIERRIEKDVENAIGALSTK